MKRIVEFDGVTRLVRIGRDGKGRYCLYYNVHHTVLPKTTRAVLAGGLTKLAAYKMFDLLGKTK